MAANLGWTKRAPASSGTWQYEVLVPVPADEPSRRRLEHAFGKLGARGEPCTASSSERPAVRCALIESSLGAEALRTALGFVVPAGRITVILRA